MSCGPAQSRSKATCFGSDSAASPLRTTSGCWRAVTWIQAGSISQAQNSTVETPMSFKACAAVPTPSKKDKRATLLTCLGKRACPDATGAPGWRLVPTTGKANGTRSTKLGCGASNPLRRLCGLSLAVAVDALGSGGARYDKAGAPSCP